MMRRTVAHQKPIQFIKLKGGKNLMQKKEENPNKNHKNAKHRLLFEEENII